MLTVSCLLCGEEEGATVGKFSWCPWLAALSSSPLPLWYFLRTSWVPACLRLLTRHFFRAERLVIGARRWPHPHPHPHDAAWESELDGSQLIVPATLYPFSICSALALFSWGKDRARTRLGEIKHRISARKVEGVLSMPHLRFLLPLLILCCCDAGEISGSLGWGGG